MQFRKIEASREIGKLIGALIVAETDTVESAIERRDDELMMRRSQFIVAVEKCQLRTRGIGEHATASASSAVRVATGRDLPERNLGRVVMLGLRVLMYPSRQNKRGYPVM